MSSVLSEIGLSLASTQGGISLCLENEWVTIEQLRHLKDYGIILIVSHGWYEDRAASKSGDSEKVVFFCSGELVPENEDAIPDEIKMDLREVIDEYRSLSKPARVGIVTRASGETKYSIYPKFIRYYSSSEFPNSLVVMSSCNSDHNGTMRYAFLENGAGAYVGFYPSTTTSRWPRLGHVWLV